MVFEGLVTDSFEDPSEGLVTDKDLFIGSMSSQDS